MWQGAVEETYLVFEFDEPAWAEQAEAQITEWVKGFRIAFGQLAARREQRGHGATLVVRLGFSEHERLAYERWQERIPREPPFARAQRWAVVPPGDPGHGALRMRFQELAEQ